MKFDEITNQLSKLEDNGTTKQISPQGQQLLKEYNGFIEILSEWVKESDILKVISMISSEKIGTEKFMSATRLDTMTSGGKTGVAPTFTFNQDDKLLDYLDGKE